VNELGKMKIIPELFCNRVLKQHGQQGQDACEIMAASINAVDPYLSVTAHLHIIDRLFRVKQYQRAFLIGFGKASVPMAKAIIDSHSDKLVFAKVITKDKKFRALMKVTKESCRYILVDILCSQQSQSSQPKQSFPVFLY